MPNHWEVSSMEKEWAEMEQNERGGEKGRERGGEVGVLPVKN